MTPTNPRHEDEERAARLWDGSQASAVDCDFMDLDMHARAHAVRFAAAVRAEVEAATRREIMQLRCDRNRLAGHIKLLCNVTKGEAARIARGGAIECLEQLKLMGRRMPPMPPSPPFQPTAEPGPCDDGWSRDDTATRDILLLISREVPIERIASWTDAEVQAVENWASAYMLHASDHDDVVVPPEPECVQNEGRGA